MKDLTDTVHFEANVERFLGDQRIAKAVSRICILFLVYLFCLSVYLSNFRCINAIDTLPARFLSLSLIREGDLDLNEFVEVGGSPLAVTTREYNGKLLSDFPVGVAFLGAFFYKIGFLLGLSTENDGLWWLEKFAGANIAAIAAVAFFFLVRYKIKAPFFSCLLLWVVFAFGSSNWVPCSQALWQHSAAQAMVIFAMLSWPLKGQKSWILPGCFLTGMFLSFSSFMRPTILVLLPIWGLFVLIRFRRGIIFYGIGILVGLLPLVLYHLTYFGQFVGGGYFDLQRGQFSSFSQPIYRLVAHLFAPSRGLLIFTPFFILIPFGFIKTSLKYRTSHFDGSLWGLSVFAIAAIILSYQKWWAGWGYGPRFWSDVLPFLCLLCLPAVTRLLRKQLGIILVVLLMIYCIAIQVVGAVRYDGGWDQDVDVDKNPAACWNILDNTVFYCLTGGMSHYYFGTEKQNLVLHSPVIDISKEGNHKYLIAGFHEPEPWGVWTRAIYPAVIRFSLPHISNGNLLFQIRTPETSWEKKTVFFYLNGHEIGQYRFSSENQKGEFEDCHFRVPVSILNGRVEELKITSSRGTYLGPGLSRFYGIALSRFAWLTESQYQEIQQRIRSDATTAR